MPLPYTFRASFSILSTWESGDWERAIKMYFKLDTFCTPAMAAGKDLHKEWENETAHTKCLPKVLGGAKLKNPILEHKIVYKMADWLNLVGVIDCNDGDTIYEYKSGVQSSESYASGKQHGVYALLARSAGYDPKLIKIYHYNQYTKKKDISLIWVTDKLVEEAREWVETLAGQMHDYYLTNKIYERFNA